MRDTPLPTPARLLGFAGLLPFVALGLAGWVVPWAWVPAALAAYGATILAFLGAVHWGMALRGEPEAMWGRLGLGVVPQLVGWVALLLPLGAGLLVLAVAILGVAAVERWAAGRGLVPLAYLVLRAGLSAGASLCLVVGAAAVLV